MIKHEFTPEEEEKQMSMMRDLKAANYKVIDEETGKIQVTYDYTYKGTLEFYHETGMEGLASIVHDDRGWREEHDFNNDSKKWDGPLKKFKSLDWSVFLEGGEYLKVFEADKVIWEGILIKDRIKMKEKGYAYHFLPKEIPFEKWCLWCQKEYKVTIATNKPVFAEKKENFKED